MIIRQGVILNGKKYLKVALLLQCLILVGCTVNRGIIRRDSHLESKNLFQVNDPGADWKFGETRWYAHSSSSNSKTVFDGSLYKCPEGSFISIGRASIELKLADPALSMNGTFDDFQKVVTRYVDSAFFSPQKDTHTEKLSQQKSSLLERPAVEIAGRSLNTSGVCSDDSPKPRTILHKMVIVKGGDRIDYLEGGQKLFPMVVLWYSSPEESFKENEAVFDSLVSSFHFLNEKSK